MPNGIKSLKKLAKLAVLPSLAMVGLINGTQALAQDCSGGYASCITYASGAGNGTVTNMVVGNSNVVYDANIATSAGVHAYPLILHDHRFSYAGGNNFAYILPIMRTVPRDYTFTDTITFESRLSEDIEYYAEIGGYVVYRIKGTNLGVVIMISHQFPGGDTYKEIQVAHSFHNAYAMVFSGRFSITNRQVETPSYLYFDILPVLLGPVTSNELTNDGKLKYIKRKLVDIKMTPGKGFSGGAREAVFSLTYQAEINHQNIGTCSYTGARNLSIDMKRIQASQIADRGSTAYGGSETITLNCSQNATVDPNGVRTGVIPFAVLTDQRNTSNRTDILTTNTGSGYAKNVGIKLRRSNANQNEFVKFGPDSTQKGTPNQWQFGALTDTSPEITLEAHYVNNAPAGESISGGKVQGVATITFSYQ